MLFLLSSCVKPVNIGAQRPPPRKIITAVFLQNDVQLQKSENAWKPGRKREGLPVEPESQRTQVRPNILTTTKQWAHVEITYTDKFL